MTHEWRWVEVGPNRKHKLPRAEAAALILAWSRSGGFAATHAAGATDRAIVEDLLSWLHWHGFAIVQTESPKI